MTLVEAAGDVPTADPYQVEAAPLRHDGRWYRQHVQIAVPRAPSLEHPRLRAVRPRSGVRAAPMQHRGHAPLAEIVSPRSGTIACLVGFLASFRTIAARRMAIGSADSVKMSTRGWPFVWPVGERLPDPAASGFDGTNERQLRQTGRHHRLRAFWRWHRVRAFSLTLAQAAQELDCTAVTSMTKTRCDVGRLAVSDILRRT
jgi:hypothetical protein